LTGNELRLIATSQDYSGAQDAGSVDVPIAAVGVVLTPGSKTFGARANAQYEQTWQLKNLGSEFHTFSVTATCDLSIVQFCTPGSTYGADSAGTATVFVDWESWGTSVGDSGFVQVVAVQTDDPTVADTSRYTVVIGTPQTPVISTADAGSGPTHERGLCLTMAAGPGAAINCGDLRLAHGLPPLTTFNQVRAAQLVYNSRTADPHALVPVNVLIPEGGVTPDSVRARLAVEVATGVVDTTQASWNGLPWSPGRAARVVVPYAPDSLATGIYDYTVEIVAYVAGTPYDTTDTGTLTIVNRRDDSRLVGVAGWWVAGVEELNLTPSDNRLLWIGGDGSARVYDSVSTGLWKAESLTRPDSIQRVGSRYVRRVPGGTRVEFDATGRHVATISRLEDSTRFDYDNDRLDELHVPSAAGMVDMYVFEYEDGELDEILPQVWEQRVQVRRSNGRITGLVDASIDSVMFGYNGGGTLITSRTDRVGTTTTYSYDSGHTVTRISTDLGGGDSIVSYFQPFETRGLEVAVDTAHAYAWLDGPRTDVGDSTRFWLDRYGAPVRIVDALGNETTIERDDSRFPGLATAVTDPHGLVSEAFYNDRGTLDSTMVERDAGTAVTKYEWDTRWDFATKIRMPMNEVTEMAYDSTTGNRLWQQDSRGPSSRVEFTYNADGQLEEVDGPLTAPSLIEYDVYGNLERTTTSEGFETEYVKDALGRDSIIRTPIDGTLIQEQRVFYDLKGRVDSTLASGPAIVAGSDTIPAQTLFVRNEYDGEGRLTKVVRESRPDTAGIGPDSTMYVLDAIGRVVRERHAVGGDSTVYDVAGNAIAVHTARSHEITMKYDALNRLVRRVLPEVTYNASGCGVHGGLDGNLCIGVTFPAAPNDGGSGILIPADTAVFTYDAVGNMIGADNRYAQIRRTYNTDGSVETDSTRMRDYDGLAFNTHVFGISYDYDLNGRRTSLFHPDQLAPTVSGTPQTEQGYEYNSFGALQTVTNVLGNAYGFLYDLESRPDSLSMPYAGGYVRRAYDDDGRMTLREEVVPGALGTVRTDTLGYDQRGKTVSVGFGGHFALQVEGTYTYSGLGHAAVEDVTVQNQNSRDTRVFDALGNAVWHRRDGGENDPPEFDNVYGSAGMQLQFIYGRETSDQFFIPDTTYNMYDQSGNMRYTGTRSYAWVGFPADLYIARRVSANYYGADQKLMFNQTLQDSILGPSFNLVSDERTGTFSEYWYDALGRRILTRAWGSTPTGEICTKNGPECVDAVTRTVWDGDQVLYELRLDGGAFADLDQTAVPAAGDSTYGWVGYTHGPGIDAPLDVMRMALDGGQLTLIPHANWRGHYDFMTDTTGAQFGCAPAFYTSCPELYLPGTNRRAFLDVRAWRQAEVWVGNVVHGQQDRSGLMYMRNRYYDPATGRFTQQDPIGLAGGLNLYGFANGDPVNFTDPFGLKVCFDEDGRDELVDATSEAIGAPIAVDDSGCVAEPIEGTDDSNEDLLDRFNRLVGSDNEYSVTFGGSGCSNVGSNYCPTTRRTRVRRADIGTTLPAKYLFCGLFGGTFGEVTTTAASIVSHELLGHGYAHEIGWDPYDQSYAIAAENVFRRATGGAQRCGG
jgi:RHS repeat-associated protein